ncbi:MAG: molybdate ABC transporter substrate-binding protein [Coriobacteriales bacterium]|nr:molybdate ABC transporter substrate-binding protein [Coriobacteriales bacterium]
MHSGLAGLKLAFLCFAGIAVAHALAGCAPEQSVAEGTTPTSSELRVSAATTLKGAFEDLAPAFEKASDVDLVFNFGASGVLQKQIEGGAPVDVFASASPAQIDELIEGSFVSAESTATFTSNDLVVIVPKGNPKGIAGSADLVKADRLTTGDPETAPHGTKAKEWLQAQRSWSSLEHRFVFAENAAQTFDYVARGEVDAGIVFGSEAFGKDEVEVVYTVPAEEIKPIKYVIAPLKASDRQEIAREFIEFVLSAEGQKALQDNGFKAATGATAAQPAGK